LHISVSSNTQSAPKQAVCASPPLETASIPTLAVPKTQLLSDARRVAPLAELPNLVQALAASRGQQQPCRGPRVGSQQPLLRRAQGDPSQPVSVPAAPGGQPPLAPPPPQAHSLVRPAACERGGAAVSKPSSRWLAVRAGVLAPSASQPAAHRPAPGEQGRVAEVLRWLALGSCSSCLGRCSRWAGGPPLK